jgi:hypothetical protein
VVPEADEPHKFHSSLGERPHGNTSRQKRTKDGQTRTTHEERKRKEGPIESSCSSQGSQGKTQRCQEEVEARECFVIFIYFFLEKVGNHNGRKKKKLEKKTTTTWTLSLLHHWEGISKEKQETNQQPICAFIFSLSFFLFAILFLFFSLGERFFFFFLIAV